MGQNNPGYGNLTPDQSNMLQQVGWFPRADMVLPTGQTLQQPTGYSGLTPGQAATVNQLGYYTPGALDNGSSTSIFDKLGKLPGLLDKFGGGKLTSQTDAANAAADRAAALARAGGGGGGAMMSQLQQLLGGHSVSDMLYDPSLALQLLYRGAPPVGGMSQIGGQPGSRLRNI